MTYNPQIGHTVTVADKASAYNGREAVVTAATVYADVMVYTVAVGNVSFALTRAKLREIKYVRTCPRCGVTLTEADTVTCGGPDCGV